MLLRLLLDHERYFDQASKITGMASFVCQQGKPGTGKTYSIVRRTLEKIEHGLSIACVTPSNKLRNATLGELVEAVNKVYIENGKSFPATIVFIGPDDDKRLPEEWDFVVHVEYPGSDLGPALPANKPIIVIGCLSRLAVWAAGWKWQFQVVFYDEYGLANWLDTVVASSLVTTQGQLVTVGDTRQCSGIVDTGGLVVMARNDDESCKPGVVRKLKQRGSDKDDEWASFLLLQTSVMHAHHKKHQKLKGLSKQTFGENCVEKALNLGRRSHEYIVRMVGEISYEPGSRPEFRSKKQTSYQNTALEGLQRRCLVLHFDEETKPTLRSTDPLWARRSATHQVPKQKPRKPANPFTTSYRNDRELTAMARVRAALLKVLGGSPQQVLSLSAYALQKVRCYN